MTKEELIQLLKDYNENNSKLKLRRKEKRVLENSLKEKVITETNIAAILGINMDIQSKNKISDKIGNAVIRAEVQREDIRKKIKEIEKEIEILEERIEEADIRLNSLYYKEREIMNAYYCENRTAEEISQNLYFKLFNRTCSPRYIRNIIKTNTEKLLKL